MKAWIAAVLAMFLAVSSAAGAEPKVYALVVGDTTPAAQWGKLMPNITLDLLNMYVMLSENLPKPQLQLVTLDLEHNENATPQAILKGLDHLHPSSNDTLLVYFTGHGAADDHGHYFSLAGGKLYREELKREMLNKNARLTVLLSDCCNVRSDGRSFMAPAPRVEVPKTPTPLFQSLFLKPHGLVDVNGSSPGESAFFTSEKQALDEMPGSLFTKALTEYAHRNQERQPTWNDLLSEVGIKVHVAFREGYPQGASVAKGAVVQHDQTVYAIDYPDMPKKQGPRSGVHVRDHEGKGAWILSVDAGSPAAQVFDLSTHKYVSLQPGQLIVAANGRAVSGANAFAAVVKGSPQILRFTLADARGQHEYLMRLRY